MFNFILVLPYCPCYTFTKQINLRRLYHGNWKTNPILPYQNRLTQKQLGEKLGFTGRTPDVRMAQYESEARSPKQDLINQLAQIFHVDSRALTVPDIDTYVGLMHTLFALEDMYGLKIKDIDGELCLCLDKL